MAKTKRCVLPIKAWGTFGSGEDRSYKIIASSGNYVIERAGGRNRRGPGWDLRFENILGRTKLTGLHQRISKDGEAENWHWVGGDRFRSPASAALAANKHCARVEAGLAGLGGGKRRRKRR